MSLPRWDEEMKFELLRLKSELRPENFRALHQPLGLGAMRADPAKGMQSPFPAPPTLTGHNKESREKNRGIPASVPSMPKTLQEAIGPLQRLDPEYDVLGEAPQEPRGFSKTEVQTLARLLLVHALDLAFVCLCLSIGLILLSWVVDPQHVSLNLGTLKQASPLQFLQKLQTLALIVGIYTAFVLYWIFFKVVSGTTLGETCIELIKHQQNAGSARRANGSGDS